MTNKALIFLSVVISLLIGFFLGQRNQFKTINPYVSKLDSETYPLKKYSVPNLKKTTFSGRDIIIKKEINRSEKFITHQYFSYIGDKKVSGLINIPIEEGKYPIALLIRGYVDKEIYSSGVGTQRIGEFLAQNGYITIAPDFLGYGQSDKASVDGLEDRFQTYTTTLELLASLKNLNNALLKSNISGITADNNNVVIWGHSNGGQIALTILAITEKKYPTVLWAPVSKPFPYSILFYTDQYSDKGKYLRKLIADFEDKYDIKKYDPTNYYHLIKAPVQIHQGMLDEDVPTNWSNELYELLSKHNDEIEYFTYDNADHNLMPDGWNKSAFELLSFYNNELPNE